MPLPSFGVSLSMSQINAEFGRGNNLGSYRGTQYYFVSSGPFNFPSGTISYINFYGTQLNAPAAASTSHTVTEGGAGGTALGYSVLGSAFPGNIAGGNMVSTSTLGSRTIKAFFMYIVKGYSTVYFIAEGDQRISTVGNWWTYGTYGDIDTTGNVAFNRANTVAPDGDYDSGNNITRWVISQSEEPAFSGAKTDRLIIYA